MNNNQKPKMRTIKQVAIDFELPVTAVRRLVKEERISFIRIGNKVLINENWLAQYLSNGCVWPKGDKNEG
ncbi:DNA binding domain-containing protein, excisionase family [Ruminococcaceae bacterium FB2012]|nr:DNA binding domain-containing protein, excisionase family [Ruminococcaceae bacterium FB2012]